MPRLLATLAVLLVGASAVAQTDDGVRAEVGVDRVNTELGVTGRGVIVAIVDRGVDYEHPDFRNADGTTRLRLIYDVTDDRGANDADNPTGIGTVYTRDEIDAALASGTRLATRDAVGHGTATMGIAAGNGFASDGRYAGMAPDADLIAVKFTTEGAPAHDGEPAEAPFYDPERLPVALDFVNAHADAAGRPIVYLGNFGSIGGPMDGTSRFARDIDERFGPGVPGRVFITGTSDDGGIANHAGGTVGQGQTAEIQVRKGHPGFLRFDLWYPGADRFDVEVIAPSGTTYGPYTGPPNNSSRFERPSGAGLTVFHAGSDVGYFDASNDEREIVVDMTGAMGIYTIRLIGATVSDGTFDASLNPSTIFSAPNNRFETFAVPGYSVWDLASAQQNLAPNSYVLKPTWTDVDGNTRTYVGNDVGAGELWPGSGIGPTYDGRLGVTVSAPGQANITPFAPRSNFARFRSNLVVDGPAPYGILAFVSGAAPVVTGIVALMLEADPTLDAAEVRAIVEQTARADAFTGEVPNARWGYGKIDAFAAVTRARPVASEGEPAASEISLSIAPNPALSRSVVTFTLDRAQTVALEVVDALGRRLAVPYEGGLEAGTHRVDLDAARWPAGVYVVRLVGEGAASSRRLTVVR